MKSRDNLYAWQNEAALRAASTSLLIAAAPGAGKTVTTLTAAADGLASGKFRRILLVAPRLILDTVWPVEAALWEHTAHLTFSMAHQCSGARRAGIWFNDPARIVTCTTDTFPSFVEECVRRKSVPVDCIIWDESQALKNPGSARTRAALVAAKIVPHVILCSGTPSPNGVIDCWSPGKLTQPAAPFWGDNFHAWRNRHFVKRGPFAWTPKAGATDHITKELAKAALSIKLEDAVDVPEAVFAEHPFEHDSATRRLIGEFLAEGSVIIPDQPFGTGDTKDAGGFLMRLQQLTNGFAYTPDTQIISMARAEALREIVENAEGPVLAAIRFKADPVMIKRLIPKAVVYSGDTPLEERRKIIERWNADGIPLLLGAPASMGHGLNLQHGSARTIVWYSGSFSYEQFGQFNARLVRNGQCHVVSIISLISTVGIDRAIQSVIIRKETGEAALMAALGINRG
jgi:hypothetical protein